MWMGWRRVMKCGMRILVAGIMGGEDGGLRTLLIDALYKNNPHAERTGLCYFWGCLTRS
ncbi:hypothetical protein KS4_28690 [Poriferisphaera corsica]|uniref:Uncharacterized protein n=1 Tax=Poriferisphaera corsica TaxID=2528020 RepID=A0A517YX44_9BACT|nr:hypothetical protein KS4_28690 [Poriferisphaera corsica]